MLVLFSDKKRIQIKIYKLTTYLKNLPQQSVSVSIQVYHLKIPFGMIYNIYIYIYIHTHIYYTICRHACFGVYVSSVQLCNTSRYVTRPYISTCECSHQTHVGQPGHVNAPRHAQSVMGPECSNYHEGSELCNIANGHPINSAQRVLNNTEVKERNTICRHACFGVCASSVQLCTTSRYVTRPYIAKYISFR